MEIVDAHRVRVTQRAEGHLGRGPRADAGNGLEHGGGGDAHLQPRPEQVRESLEPRRVPGGAADDVGPALLHAERMERVIGERGQRLGRRLEPEPT